MSCCGFGDNFARVYIENQKLRAAVGQRDPPGIGREAAIAPTVRTVHARCLEGEAAATSMMAAPFDVESSTRRLSAEKSSW